MVLLTYLIPIRYFVTFFSTNHLLLLYFVVFADLALFWETTGEGVEVLKSGKLKKPEMQTIRCFLGKDDPQYFWPILQVFVTSLQESNISTNYI